jgi:hypothetical protein
MWMMDALDGRLAPSDRQRLTAHMEACSQCRADWEALNALEGMLTSPAMAFPAPGFVDRVEARLAHLEAQRRTLVGGLILLGAAAALCLVAVPSLLNGRNPLEAYGAFLRNAYELLGHGLLLGYQLLSALWLILNALSSSVDIPLANLLTYAAAIVLAVAAWRRALTSQRVHIRTTENGY